MARFAIVNRLTDAAGLKDFAVDGYAYADQVSSRLRLRRPGLERPRLGLPAPAGRVTKLVWRRSFRSPRVRHRTAW